MLLVTIVIVVAPDPVTDSGEKLAVTFDGKPLTLKLTDPLKLFNELAVIA